MLKGCAAVSNVVPRRKEFPTHAYLLPKTFLSMRGAQCFQLTAKQVTGLTVCRKTARKNSNKYTNQETQIPPDTDKLQLNAFTRIKMNLVYSCFRQKLQKRFIEMREGRTLWKLFYILPHGFNFPMEVPRKGVSP